MSNQSLQGISAVTFIVSSMKVSVEFYESSAPPKSLLKPNDSVEFYESLGFKRLFGGADADFTSFQVGACYLNIASGEKEKSTLWGRVIFYVDDVDKMYQRALKCNMKPLTQPSDAPWGERYFHLRDPDENELSFAKPLNS